jgi:hypothetical protein
LCTAFLYVKFRFVLFWRKNIRAKAVLKMLVKLTQVILNRDATAHKGGLRK